MKITLDRSYFEKHESPKYCWLTFRLGSLITIFSKHATVAEKELLVHGTKIICCHKRWEKHCQFLIVEKILIPMARVRCLSQYFMDMQKCLPRVVCAGERHKRAKSPQENGICELLIHWKDTYHTYWCMWTSKSYLMKWSLLKSI